ncbi:MAG: uracil phosphoribosyltransferase [Planctomycetota bacterium]|nr:uracil phosphoribosyltransferase [Planctomycetota bacterium]
MPTPTSHVRVVDHPVLAHLLTEARDRQTPPGRFRAVIAQLGELLAYEAVRDLPLKSAPIQTPLEPFPGQRLGGKVTLVPILRAGLGLAEGAQRLLPDASVGHIGMFRDERRLSPVSYYDKLPPDIANTAVLLLDPMLATGGSALAALELLRSRGCRDIRLICVLASPEGIERLAAEAPDVRIITAAVDRELDDRGYILPGLGDAGDRMFGTSE